MERDMNNGIQDKFIGLGDSILQYLPNLIAGTALVLVGWLCGWLTKKLLAQLARVVRLDRYLSRSRWGDDFKKADVRRGLYDIIGNIGFAIVFLLFLDNAFIAWQLTLFSDLLGKAILFLPKLIIACAVFGVGWLIASLAQKAIQKMLLRESIPRASLVSRFVKGIIVVFFSAMAIVVIDVAKEIVVIAFSAIFVGLAIIGVIFAFYGGRDFFEKRRSGDGKQG
jgi:hypothetical protein